MEGPGGWSLTDADIVSMMMAGGHTNTLAKPAGGAGGTAVESRAVAGRQPIGQLRTKSDLFANGAEGASLLTKYGSGHEHMDTAVQRSVTFERVAPL